MDLKSALKEQFGAGLAMLAECVEKCPAEMWTAGEYPRYYWRVALHAAFFTHVGLAQSEDAFKGPPWAAEDPNKLWDDPAYLEPYELPDGVPPYSQKEVLDYISFVRSTLDTTIDGLNLDIDETGFRWYPNMSKLSNVLMTLRHIQGHVGQLSELLMARGIDTDWIAKA